jgi:DNA polymerase III subunit gamma/tau
MALYLTYRPKAFADVVGQDHIVTTLERAVESRQVSHAYLFSGTRGTGKTSVARILAKTILLQGIDDPVIRSHIEKGMEDGSFVDLIEIDAASNRRIDDVRDLIEKIGFSPSVSTAKVYIIDEVHMLTKEAFNALLKTLEEPPEYAFFILATTEIHKVPDTIQSRCQRFLFKRVKDEDIVRRLQYIIDQERLTVDREAIRAIARHAGGSFRDGISLLDQLRTLPKVTLSDVTDRIGRTSTQFIEDIVSAIGKKDLETIARVIDDIDNANVPADGIAADLLTLIREHMHTAIEKREPVHAFLTMTDTLLLALRDMRSSPLPSLVLESALVRLCDAYGAQEGKVTAPLKAQVVEPKKSVTEEVVNATAAEPEAKKSENTIVQAPEFTRASVQSLWSAVLKALPSAALRMSLKDATIGMVDGSSIDLVFASSFHREKVADTTNSRHVEEALLAVLKRPARIRCVLERDQKRTAPGPDTDLVEAAEEVFGRL